MYSHGLEKIYAFENINPKSVKTVASSERKPFEGEKSLETSKRSSQQQQLLFDLGPYYQEALPSFRLLEPINSLGLSSFVAKLLQTKEIRTCEEACHFIINGSHKGLGQSHKEELEAKVSAFLGPNPFKLQKCVDWQSLVRCASYELEAKSRYCLLARYKLEELSGATSVEQQEIHRLSREQIIKILDQAQELLVLKQSRFIEDSLTKIFEGYLMPWLKSRHGFATSQEIFQRLLQISHSPELFWQTQEFLKLFGDPIKLTFVEEGIYANDTYILDDYVTVKQCALDFFYTPHTSYPLQKLYSLVTKTLAHLGHGFAEGFIIKVLTTTPKLLADPNTATIFLAPNLD